MWAIGTLLITILVLAGVCALGWLIGKGIAKAKEARLVGREVLTEAELYGRFYATEAIREDVVCYVFRLIESATGVPFGKLRPSDRFDRELAEIGTPMDGSHYEIFSTIDHLRKRFGKQSYVKTINTIDDLIRVTAEIVGNSPLENTSNDSLHGAVQRRL